MLFICCHLSGTPLTYLLYPYKQAQYNVPTQSKSIQKPNFLMGPWNQAQNESDVFSV